MISLAGATHLGTAGAATAVDGTWTVAQAATLSGTLSVGQATTLTGAVTLSSTLAVAQAATFSGDLLSGLVLRKTCSRRRRAQYPSVADP